jgi:hypothetical protein
MRGPYRRPHARYALQTGSGSTGSGDASRRRLVIRAAVCERFSCQPSVPPVVRVLAPGRQAQVRLMADQDLGG